MGYKFWGSPRSIKHGYSAFANKRGYDIKKYWNQIPSDTEILITHGPPLGFGDLTTHGSRVGC